MYNTPVKLNLVGKIKFGEIHKLMSRIESGAQMNGVDGLVTKPVNGEALHKVNGVSLDNSRAIGLEPVRRSDTIKGIPTEAGQDRTPTLHQAAIESIQTIPEVYFSAIAAFPGNELYGPIDRYAVTPDGRKLTQGEFLVHYARATNRITEKAKSLLTGTPELEELRKRRAILELSIPASEEPQQLPSSSSFLSMTAISEPRNIFPKSHQEVLDGVNHSLKKQIIHLASDATDEEIAILGHDIAIMNLEHATRREHIRTGLQTDEKIKQNAEIMQKARDYASKPEVFELYSDLASTTFERTFLAALDLKLYNTNYIPPLLVVNDMDFNLGVNDANTRLKPGNIIGRLLDNLDAIHKTPIHQRLPLTDNLPQNGELVDKMFRYAGKQIPLFSDAGEAARLAQEHDIPFSILSANMVEVVKGAAEMLSTPQSIPVIGLGRDSLAGYEKPLHLAQVQIDNPAAVILFSDDSDTSSVKALKKGAIVDEPNTPRLEDVVFFATREPDADGKTYRLQQTLFEQGVPYAQNRSEEKQDGEIHGYQGVLDTIKLYIRWKEQRVSEGWATTEAGAFVDKLKTIRLKEGSVEMPVFVKRDVLMRANTPHDAEGNLVWDYWIGTAGIARDPKTDDVIALYKGTNQPPEGQKAISNHGFARLAPDGVTVLQRHKSPVVTVAESHRKSLPHGIEDTRITTLDNGIHLLVSNASNKDIRDKGLFAHKDARLQGCYPYAHIATDIGNPETYIALGRIGPEFYLKNAFFHPEIIDDKLLLFYRDFPNIQASFLPLGDLEQLANDPRYRREFWERELEPETREKNTVLKPIFPWEAKGDSRFPQGQISGGAPARLVSYRDRLTGQPTEAWYLTYNATTGFDAAGNTLDRVIGACLLDRHNPRKVIARSPEPIIRPTRELEKKGRYPDITFTIGNDLDPATGEMRNYYTSGDQALSTASADVGHLVAYLSQHDRLGRLLEC